MLPYLARTFLERGNGFHFADAPPPEIADRRFLKSADPWEVLACTLARLQKGDFTVASVPAEVMKNYGDANLWIACAHLIGFAAPRAVVRSLFEVFSQPVHNPLKRYVCSAAVDAGDVWAAERILDAYLDAETPSERQYLQFELSWLLEAAPGAVWAGPDLLEVRDENAAPFEDPVVVPDVDPYVAMLRVRLETVRQGIAPDERVAVAEGTPVHIDELARTLLGRLREGDSGERIERGRMLLEATTGLDCRGFFNRDYMLQPLTATAIVEDFVESGAAGRYLPGVRYFFGHRIPE